MQHSFNVVTAETAKQHPKQLYTAQSTSYTIIVISFLLKKLNYLSKQMKVFIVVAISLNSHNGAGYRGINKQIPFFGVLHPCQLKREELGRVLQRQRFCCTMPTQHIRIAQYMLWPCVSLSVCTSHAGSVSKRLNPSSSMHEDSSFLTPKIFP